MNGVTAAKNAAMSAASVVAKTHRRSRRRLSPLRLAEIAGRVGSRLKPLTKSNTSRAGNLR